MFSGRHSRLNAFAILTSALVFVIGIAQQPARAQGPPAASVTVAPPLARRITQWDEYAGRFEAMEQVDVRARVSGFIDKIHFKDGQVVKPGDLLFTLDKRPYQIAAEIAKGEIGRAKAQVELAETDVERVTPLARTGAATKRDLDQRTSSLSVAQAAFEIATAGNKSADLNLEWTEVRAPIGGRISDRKADVGSLVSGGSTNTTLLANIVALDPIYFRFDISEADYLRYVRAFNGGKRGSGRETEHPVRIKLADDKDFVHTGMLDFVDNQLNPRSGTMRARAKVDNKGQLFTPGLFARLQLFGGEFDALLLPDAAIVSDQARKIVFTVGADNVVVAAPVELGQLSDGLRVIRNGLKPDSRVVIDGLASPFVRPGAKVNPQAGQVKSASGN